MQHFSTYIYIFILKSITAITISKKEDEICSQFDPEIS